MTADQHLAPVLLAETSVEATSVPTPPASAGGVREVLAWAREVGRSAPRPGSGGTRERWEILAAVGAQDLVAARVLEPHLDALAILGEQGTSGRRHDDATWGVWAAEGPGFRLEAHAEGGTWRLEGTKPWCSLAGQVSSGLVTAWLDDRRRGLFSVRTDDPGFRVDSSQWAPQGLRAVETATVHMDGVVAEAVGGPGWYLERDGFAWGGLSVAAVWYGGAVGVARRLAQQCVRRDPDQIALMHLGAVDAHLAAARAVLDDAASDVDAGRARGPLGVVVAARARQVVSLAAEEVLAHVGHALGPGPLSQEPEHVARVADLTLYLRQHHAERDAAALGRLLLAPDRRTPPW